MRIKWDNTCKNRKCGFSVPLESLLGFHLFYWMPGQMQSEQRGGLQALVSEFLPYPLPVSSLSTPTPTPRTLTSEAALCRCPLAGDDILARGSAEWHRGQHLPLEAVQPAHGCHVHPLLPQRLGQPLPKPDGHVLHGKWWWRFCLIPTFTVYVERVRACVCVCVRVCTCAHISVKKE